MSESEKSRPLTTALYPEPTIVVGIGRFGLAILERLGDDWRWLSTSAAGDSSLKNLRLLAVRSEEGVEEERWRRPETALSRVAYAAGEDDLPTLALKFALVRALGLIRFRDGAYQLALPRDAGVVEKGDRHDTRRQRFFDWHTLDSDPRRAVERLHRLSQRDPEVDLFLTPIVERAVHGQSPLLLLHLIGRCRSLKEGRDPAPWDWIAPVLKPHAGAEGPARVPFDERWWSEDDRLGLLDGVVPDPLPNLPALVDDPVLRARLGSAATGQRRPNVVIPKPFWPKPGDLSTPLSPQRMLRVDWETSGWVAEELGETESVEFDPVESSLFRLGFFDHDASSGFDEKATSEALVELGKLVHRGLLRLWLDLQRERDESISLQLRTRHRAGAETALEQCLEILGELIIRPLLASQENDPPLRPEARGDRWVDGPTLPDAPSAQLKDAVVDIESPEAMPERPLLERLADLGLHFGKDELGQRPLFRELTLHPRDLDGEARLTDLRSAINDETRHLVSFEHLKTYRQRPTRQPPRLTVYVVGEAKEAFARRSFRPILRALHQELIRAYGPIFDTNREGFDRALSIVPIVWTPHPADAFGGDHPEANRIEEASILEAVHELRRWAEALPASHRCIPQIFINSRVTDSAVLGVEDAVQQTRDFLDFQIRNELGKDPWLRQAAVGFRSDDLFSTFTCVQIDFPAERAREYLANRLAREALSRLREPGREEEEPVEDELVELKPPPEDLLEPPQRRLKQKTASAADRLSSDVDDRLRVEAATTAVSIKENFDKEFEDRLHEQVHQSWRALTRNRGAMDSMVRELRQASSRHLDKTAEESRQGADRLIEVHAAKGGLKSAQTGFSRLYDSSRNMLDDAEAERRRCQDLCLRHNIPDTSPISSARASVVAAADQKPDQKPILVGLALWAVMAPAFGAPIAHSIARAFELHLNISPIEFLLGPLGWLIGGLVVFLPLFLVLRHHLNQATIRVRDAIKDLSETVRDVVEGPEGSLFGASPSIRSFFSARLHLTAALAGRNFADRIHDRVDQDRRLAFRLIQSLDVQQRRLRQRAEALGVRPTAHGEDGGPIDDDVRSIFDVANRQKRPTLLAPEQLIFHYRRHYRSIEDIDQVIPSILERAGGFERWREEACLSDTEAILDYGRDEFVDLVTEPIGKQSAFEDEVGRNLAAFVARHYANVGFGARFVGYEGFDADGLRRLAETSLLLHPELRAAFDKARHAPDAPPTTETLKIIEAQVLPNTAYILSLVQGINARSVHNLRRHEAFFDRLELPDPATPWNGAPITVSGRKRDRPQQNSQLTTVPATVAGGEVSESEEQS